MRSILAAMLTSFAHCYRWRFHPRIVGITGNAGKTSTKEAVAAVLGSRYSVRSTGGNMNNELGMPATIIGDFSDEYYRTGGTLGFWLKVLWRAQLGYFSTQTKYPQVLVLEYGADRPGDIKRLAKKFPPEVAVVTQVGEVPVHVQFFSSAAEVAREKANLVRALPPGGRAVLNYDDQAVLDMRSASLATDTTFGFGEGADVQVSMPHTRLAGYKPLGVAFNITSNGATMPVVIHGTLGRGIAAACAAAVGVGRGFGIGLAEAVEALTRLKTPPGRMRILEGVKGTVIIDDTYNASPAAMHLAIDTVRELPLRQAQGESGRKVLVLGDMRELGEHSPKAHQAVGTLAASVADELVCVGEGGRLMREAAANQLPPERLHWCDNSTEAAAYVQKLLKPGDMVLVKGSQGMRMERIVKEIMAEPHKAGELLVRQSAQWLKK